MAESPLVVDAADLLGRGEPELVDRLGPPSVRRAAGPETWLVYELDGLGLRIRLSGGQEGSPPLVASWTATFSHGSATLRAAAARLGLWPQAGPDVRADAAQQPLVRRPLLAADGRTHSLTATVRGGRFTHLSVFDEPPDWL